MLRFMFGFFLGGMLAVTAPIAAQGFNFLAQLLPDSWSDAVVVLNSEAERQKQDIFHGN